MKKDKKTFDDLYMRELENALEEARTRADNEVVEIHGDLVADNVWNQIPRNYHSVFGKKFNARAFEAGLEDTGKPGKYGRKYRKIPAKHYALGI